MITLPKALVDKFNDWLGWLCILGACFASVETGELSRQS